MDNDNTLKNSKNHDGQTIVHLAAMNGDTQMLKVLLEYGLKKSDFEDEDNQGLNPYDLAILHSKSETVEFIKSIQINLDSSKVQKRNRSASESEILQNISIPVFNRKISVESYFNHFNDKSEILPEMEENVQMRSRFDEKMSPRFKSLRRKFEKNKSFDSKSSISRRQKINDCRQALDLLQSESAISNDNNGYSEKCSSVGECKSRESIETISDLEEYRRKTEEKYNSNPDFGSKESKEKYVIAWLNDNKNLESDETNLDKMTYSDNFHWKRFLTGLSSKPVFIYFFLLTTISALIFLYF